MPVFNAQKALQAGATPDQINTYLAQRKSQGVNLTLSQPTTQPSGQAVDMPKQRSGLASLLPLLGGIGGSVVGGFAGPVGVIGGGAAGSGLGELLAEKLSGENTDIGKIATEGALGGVGSGAGLGVGKLLSLIGKGVGNELTQGAIRSGVKGGKNFASTVDELTQAEKELGFKGSPVAKGKQLAQTRTALGKQREDILTNITTPISKKKFVSDLLQSISDQPELVDEYNKSHMSSLFSLLGKTDKMPENITTKDIHDFGVSLNNLAKRAYDAKAKGDVASLNSKAAAAHDIQQAIDRILPGYLPEEQAGTVADLTKKLGHTYKLEPIYAQGARKGVSLPIVGNVGPFSRPIQAGQDLAGRLLGGAPKGGVLAASAGQAGVRSFIPSDSNVIEGDIVSEPTTNISSDETQKTNKMDNIFKLLILQDLAKTGGDNVSKLVAASQFLQPTSKLSATQEKRLSALNQAEGIYNMVENLALKAGTGLPAYLKSKVGQLPGVEGGSEEDLGRVTEALAKGLAGVLANEVGVATDKDINRWMGLMPKVTDTLDERKRVLARLKNEMGRIRQTISE